MVRRSSSLFIGRIEALSGRIAMRKIVCAALVVVLLTPAGYARAWSEGGHHLIALMAYKLLSKEEQTKLRAILEKHPRFEQDFAAPKQLSDAEEIANWRIGRAGYWPDIARRQPVYNRPKWHYELGQALIVGDAMKLSVPERPGPLPTDATLETQELYLSQAMKLCTQTLADTSKSDSDRALALCWIAHLVGDAHQPCHAGSLYMESVFAEADGDRGANRIMTRQRGNLHALWDQLLGDNYTHDGTNRRFAEITSDEELTAKGKKAIAEAEGRDPQTWLSESRRYATDSVYAPEVLDSLRLVTRGILEKPETIELSETYLKNAGRVAQVRAIEAAYRLAETWRAAIK
jgi:hypothetical protein